MTKITFKSLQENDLFIVMSEGNKKLIPSKKVKYLIWNIPAVITCPYSTPMCRKFCYALKSERMYPDVKKSRMLHLEEAKSDSFVKRMLYTINAHMTREGYKNAERVYIRVHESGDFFNYDYFCKWMTIARATASYENLYYIAYTKSIPYLKQYIETVGQIPENVAIMSSIWADTLPELIEMTQALGLNVYTADTEENVLKAVQDGNAFKCDCKNCSTCRACMHRQHKIIMCVIH